MEWMDLCFISWCICWLIKKFILNNLFILFGFILGLVAGFVDIGAKWMSHWRTGVCTPAFWLNREQCCWGSRHVEFDAVHNELCEHVSYFLIEIFFQIRIIFLSNIYFSGKHGQTYLV